MLSPHKYTIGQKVEFLPAASDTHVPRGTYTVTRALPGDDLDRTYGVRSTTDGHERILRERQLRSLGK